jgi:hypothetical protein
LKLNSLDDEARDVDEAASQGPDVHEISCLFWVGFCALRKAGILHIHPFLVRSPLSIHPHIVEESPFSQPLCTLLGS